MTKGDQNETPIAIVHGFSSGPPPVVDFLDALHHPDMPPAARVPCFPTMGVPAEGPVQTDPRFVAPVSVRNVGRKDDKGKARPDLIPTALWRAVQVYGEWIKDHLDSRYALDLRRKGWRKRLTAMLFDWRESPQRFDGLDLLTLIAGALVEGFTPERMDYADATEALLDETAHVVGYGAARYGDDNWIAVEGAPNRYLGALIRHLTAHDKGEAADADTGRSHLAHAACNVAFLLAFRNGVDTPVRELLLQDVHLEAEAAE